MTSTPRRLAALAAAWLLAVTTAPAVAAVAAEADRTFDTTPTRVVAKCKGGPGRISMTVLPRGGGSYQVTVEARRLVNVDAQWRAELYAFTAEDDVETTSTFRRRPVDRAWSFTTDLQLEGAPPAYFIVEAQRLSGEGSGNDLCFVGSSPDRPNGAFSACARGLNVLVLRPQQDGTLEVRHSVFAGAPNRRWTVQLSVESEGSGEGVLTFDRANDRGVVRTTFRLGVGEEPFDYSSSVFTVSAESATGTTCWLRIEPGTLAARGDSDDLSPRLLLRR